MGATGQYPGGRRVGFEVSAIGADHTEVLAHAGFTGGPQVGRYRVDVAAFERVALPALRPAEQPGLVVVVDEIGRMELASAAFADADDALLARPVAVLATVHARQDPVTDALKAPTCVGSP